MNADCAFRMGRRHAVCQDYAVAAGGERPYVILADGCSSSPDTDLGARLVVKTAERLLRQRVELPDPERVLLHGRGMALELELAPECLDTTLLMAVVVNGQWLVRACGDGVIAWQDREGRLHTQSLSYGRGYPAYPNYLCDAARRRAFQRLEGNELQLESLELAPSGRVIRRRTELLPAGAHHLAGRVEETAWLAVLSDGATSFVRRSEGISEPLALEAVLSRLLAFKGFQGVFAQRRLARFEQECAASGWVHQDDLALGVIRCGG